MSAKLKKLSTSRQDVFLLSETKTWERQRQNIWYCATEIELICLDSEKTQATNTAPTLVPLNTSWAMLLQASTTPSPFSSRAMTGPVVARRESHNPTVILYCSTTPQLHLHYSKTQASLLTATLIHTSVVKLLSTKMGILRLSVDFWNVYQIDAGKLAVSNVVITKFMSAWWPNHFFTSEKNRRLVFGEVI